YPQFDTEGNYPYSDIDDWPTDANYECIGIHVHHCHFEQTDGATPAIEEGLYIGKDDAGKPYLQDVIIEHNTFENMAWEAIQVERIQPVDTNCKIRYNISVNDSTAENLPGQGGGIRIKSLSTAEVYENILALGHAY